jgi:LAO/AO transport system kinase
MMPGCGTSSATRPFDTRQLASLVSAVEMGASVPELPRQLAVPASPTHRIGIAGPPGVGKSSLIGALLRLLPEEGSRTAVLAIDPSSDITGGAVLGDRVRMQPSPNVFVRSVASRGAAGGLVAQLTQLLGLFEQVGFERVIVETTGNGQTETAIRRHVDTLVVLQVPHLGDEVQALKAGLLEHADILVVNKGDDPAARTAVRHLRSALPAPTREWRAPILVTSARTGEGVSELLAAIAAHRQSAASRGAIGDERRSPQRVFAHPTAVVQQTKHVPVAETGLALDLAAIVARVDAGELGWDAAGALIRQRLAGLANITGLAETHAPSQEM